MNITYLFAGIAIGSVIPWVVMLVMISKKNREIEDASSPADLLRERNEVGERQLIELSEITAALRDQVNVALEMRELFLRLNPGSEKPSGVTCKVHKGTTEHAEYLKARFPSGGLASSTFEFSGHRWRYEHTSFDDHGEFDLLWRPSENDDTKHEAHSVMLEALKMAQDNIYAPDSNCSCHIVAPCCDCVANGGTREALKIVGDAIALAERRGA